MNTRFTIEEENIVAIYAEDSRETTLENILAAMPYMDEDTLLYRFFRIGRAERLCAGKPFLSGSAKGNVFALFDFIPHFLQAAQQFVKIFHLGNESIYRRFQLCFVACPLLFGGVFCIAFSLVLSRYDDG